MTSIGHSLKEARSKKAVSLEEVHAKTKIHPRVLQLLEDEKFEKLPSPLFVKSFLKSYAEFLEMNPEEILQAYEKVGKVEPEQVLYIVPAAKRKSPLPFSKDFILVPLYLLLAAVIAYGLYRGVGLAGAWVSKEWTGFSQSLKKAKPAAPSKSKETKPAAEKPREPSDSADWLRSVERGNFPKIGKKNQLRLSIKALDVVWVRVTCDEKVLFQNILKKGATETWIAEKNIEIWTGNSSHMALTLNNFSLGSPGKGVVKRMIISRDGLKVSSS